MTDAEKLAQVKSLMNITGTGSDAQLAVFLSFAQSEILSWLYSGKTPEGVTDVPERYIPTQVMACVAGFGLQGLENQTASTENAITRQFKYSNMLEFIRANVVPYAQVM